MWETHTAPAVPWLTRTTPAIRITQRLSPRLHQVGKMQTIPLPSFFHPDNYPLIILAYLTITHWPFFHPG